ncbi:MAG TPA: hypothetical protein VIM65_12685 [Cyclobacteriaceae bacterium]
MRVVSEIPHQDCKITIFSWNNRYLLKFEQGFMEQTYKINQYDIAAESELNTLVSENFIQKVLILFGEMEKNLNDAMAEL